MQHREYLAHFVEPGKLLPFGGFLTYKEIAKQNVFMVLADMYCDERPELLNKEREFAYMGQGEPGFSYSQVRMAIELTNKIMHRLGQKVHRHIFATCGVPEAIYNYKMMIKIISQRDFASFVTSCYRKRECLMPIEKKYSYKEIT